MIHLLFIAALQGARATQPPAPTPVPVSSPLPYPAYGTPQPGAAATRPVAGVPAQITLAQAVALAAAKSPVLAAARANERLTQIPVSLAGTAIFPSISGSASLTKSTRSNVNANNGGGNGNGGNGTFGSGTSLSKGLNVDLRQLIYDGGKVIAQIHQARASAVAGAQTYERALETLSYDVAQAYYNDLQAQATTNLDAQVVRQDEVQVDLVNAQLSAGTASRVDLATAELPVAQARVALVRQQGTALADQAAFAQQLGLDPDALVQPMPSQSGTAATAVTILPYTQAETRALALRADYLAAQNTALAAQYNVHVQRDGLMPSLTGSASYGTNSTTVAGTNYQPSGSLGLTLSIPIFDQGITRAETESAQAQLDLANADLQQSKLGVEVDVRQALAGLVSAQAAIEQAQAELTQAQEILSATQAQYRAGVTTLPLLLNAQVGLTTAETDRVSALYGLRQAEQSYLYALGESDITPTP